MSATITTTISIQKSLFQQAEILAQQLNIPPNHLFELAIENFIKNTQSQTPLDEIHKVYGEQLVPSGQAKPPHQDTKTATQSGKGPRRINQGDIYWVQLEEPNGTAVGYRHPHVVIQDDVITRSRIDTVVVCGMTSNRKRASEPGNVLLEAGEGKLSKQSVIVVSQISVVDKAQLGEYIGSLSKERIGQIRAGMRFQQLSYFARYD